ncbi:hypothetical protein H1C71_025943 [Ictidomys tridecemlineatus]|nr:hypothetical protein H1C71_025943 [Ictidomys tridecemlineatus]KAG3289627.1 hypothetical protein H1C71_025943 [Ictidomys tridecemlineatus]
MSVPGETEESHLGLKLPTKTFFVKSTLALSSHSHVPRKEERRIPSIKCEQRFHTQHTALYLCLHSQIHSRALDTQFVMALVMELVPARGKTQDREDRAPVGRG